MANEARKLRLSINENEEKAAMAAYLHDISAIFPNEERVEVAEEFGIGDITRGTENSDDYSSKAVENNCKRDI